MTNMVEQIYVIQDTEDNTLWAAKSRIAWKCPQSAATNFLSRELRYMMTPSKSNEGPVSDDTIIKFCHNIVPEKFDENDDMYRELVFETLFRMLAHRRIKIVEKKLEKIATAA